MNSTANRVVFGLALLLPAAWSVKAADSRPLKICLLSGCAEYESDKSLGELQAYLQANYNIICSRSFGKDKSDSLPGLEALDVADLMIVFTRRLTLPPEQLDRIQNYIASRRPIIGIRTASHAFQNYLEFDRQVLGGDYKNHYTNALADVEFSPGRLGHPVLAGVTPFVSRKLYRNPSVADDVIILLEGSIPGHREPVAWVRQHEGQRVFYTSLGVPEDFAQETFRRLLVNAIFWTTGRDEPATRRGAAAVESK